MATVASDQQRMDQKVDKSLYKNSYKKRMQSFGYFCFCFSRKKSNNPTKPGIYWNLVIVVSTGGWTEWWQSEPHSPSTQLEEDLAVCLINSCIKSFLSSNPILFSKVCISTYGLTYLGSMSHVLLFGLEAQNPIPHHVLMALLFKNIKKGFHFT